LEISEARGKFKQHLLFQKNEYTALTSNHLQKGTKSIPFRAQELTSSILLTPPSTPPISPNPPSTGSNSSRLGQQINRSASLSGFVFVVASRASLG
jgi:hypothetical protein